VKRALLTALFVAAVPGCAAEPTNCDPVSLFDGRTLDGWSHAGPGGFDVADGVLRTRGGLGLLWYSAREFTDYELRLRWRVTAATDNSGIFVRFPDPGDDPGVAINRGYEIQINDNPAGDPQKSGAIYGFQQPGASASRPANNWNDYRIEIGGDRYRVWLNDRLINDFTSTDPTRTGGHLGLQNHDPDSSVEFRDLTVTPTCS
jgi:hypothetical protein